MRINTNVSALNTYRNLSATNVAVSSSMTKLSSGFRINRAADDAAGLGIANQLRADVRSLMQASKNAEQANSVLQITEGASSSIQSILERMKELATQAGSDSVDADGRARIQTEYEALRDEITRTVNTTKFQGRALIDGTSGNSVNTTAGATNLALDGMSDGINISGAKAGTYTVTNAVAGTIVMTNGSVTQSVAVPANSKSVNFDKLGIEIKLDSSYNAAGTDNFTGSSLLTVTAGTTSGDFLIGSSGAYTVANSGDFIQLDRIDLSTTTLTIGALDLSTSSSTARDALDNIDTAIELVNTALGKVGAAQNRIETAMSNLKTSIQNFTAAESVIRDVDMAEEMTRFSKNSILAQAGTAMLAQANQSAQGILQLLRG